MSLKLQKSILFIEKKWHFSPLYKLSVGECKVKMWLYFKYFKIVLYVRLLTQ